jgi:hypothetical protein
MNEPQTKIDMRLRRFPSGRLTKSESGSIDIQVPIDISGQDTPVLPIRFEGSSDARPVANPDYVDEAPTEVFRPGKHPTPPAAGRIENDPWEARTIVRREDLGRPPPEPAPRPRDPTRRMDPHPFTEEPEPAEIDFSDETKMIPPRRR